LGFSHISLSKQRWVSKNLQRRGKAELFHGHLNMADASALPEPRETLDVFLATTAMVKERTSIIIVYNSGKQ